MDSTRQSGKNGIKYLDDTIELGLQGPILVTRQAGAEHPLELEVRQLSPCVLWQELKITMQHSLYQGKIERPHTLLVGKYHRLEYPACKACIASHLQGQHATLPYVYHQTTPVPS